MIYENDFCINNAKNIYAFSDIHGDFGALISCLRDCAKVIKQQNGTDWNNLVLDNIPHNLLDTEKPYIINYEQYDCLYGFKWIGGESVIVITGDIIDNFREFYTTKDEIHNGNKQFEINNEELKIMIFLRELSRVAQLHGGNVITIIGNHDHVNIIRRVDFVNKFISPLLRGNINYYNGTSRLNIFSLDVYHRLFDNYRFDFNGNVISTNKSIIFKINDFIFLHGGFNFGSIAALYNKFDLKNVNLNNFINTVNVEYNNNTENDIWISDNSILLVRDLGIHFKSTDEHNTFCKDSNDTIFKYICVYDETCFNDKYLIIGHCPQPIHNMERLVYNSSRPLYHYTHSIVKKDDTRHILEGPIKDYVSSKQDFYRKMPSLSGITGICPNKDNIAKVYRIDIAMSRAFDFGDHQIKFILRYIKPILATNNKKDIIDIFIKLLYIFFLARAPQILHIKYTNMIKTSIIRSNLRSTLSIVKRNNYFFKTDDNGKVYALSNFLNGVVASSPCNKDFILDCINECIDYIDNLPEDLYYSSSSYKYRSNTVLQQQNSVFEHKAKKYKLKYEDLLQKFKI
jgi:hypothetical protein